MKKHQRCCPKFDCPTSDCSCSPDSFQDNRLDNPQQGYDWAYNPSTGGIHYSSQASKDFYIWDAIRWHKGMTKTLERVYLERPPQMTRNEFYKLRDGEKA